jgi:uncharacterized protein (TIGR02001 family)
MKGSIKHLVAGSALIASVGAATAAEISGNVAIGTDYRFRGISQSDRDPAISGGFDIAGDSGLYAGTWMSSVDFGDGDGAATEWDIYAGYTGDFNDDVSYDVGIIYYLYPSDDADPDYDYIEWVGSMSFGDATVGLVYSHDYFGETGTYFYPNAQYGFSLPGEFSLGLHLGLNMFQDDDGEFVAANGDTEDQYLDWSIGISKDALGVTWDLSYIDTDLDDKFCQEICDATAVLSVSKSL